MTEANITNLQYADILTHETMKREITNFELKRGGISSCFS